MISIRTYLIVTGSFLLTALVAGVVVWYLYQDMPGARPDTALRDEAILGSEPASSTPEVEGVPSVEGEGEIVITADSLSESQQKILASFGYDDPSFTVTEETVICAESALGKERFEAILDGAAPSPLEAVKLIPCVTKK